MAQFPRFDARIGQRIDATAATPVGNVYVAPARNSSFESFGQGIQQITTGVGAAFAQSAKRQAADYVTKTSAQLQESTTLLLKEKEQAAFASGKVDDFAKNFMTDYDNLVEASLKTAPNKFAQEALIERMSSARNATLGHVMKFETDTRVKIYRSNLDAAMDSYIKTAALDPSQIPQFLKQIDVDFAAAQETLGIVEASDSAKAYKSMVISSAVSNTLRTSPGEADAILERFRDDIDAKQYNSLKNSTFYRAEQMKHAAEARKAAETEQNRIWGAVNGGIALDPTDKGIQRSLDSAYAEAKAQDPNVDFSSIAIKTGYLPAGMKNEISGKLANGTPLEQVDASSKLMNILNAKPQLVDKLSIKEKAKAKLINDYIQSGISPEKAVQYATTHVYDAKNPELKEREKQAKTEGWLDFTTVENEFTGGLISRTVDRVFGSGIVGVPEQMKSEYESLARTYYIDEGLDAKQASKVATQDIKARWYASDVTGRSRFMKQAPELVFGNEAGTSWIREQLQTDLAAYDIKQLDDVMLEPSPRLSRDGLPVYQLFKVYEDGKIDAILDKNNQPLLFQPDFKNSPTYKQMLSKYPGNTDAEREANYLEEVARQKQLNLAIGQPADLRGGE